MVSRRNFIRHSASAVATGLIMPSVLNESNLFASSVGANDQINVALIGCRSMGWADLSDFLIHPEVNCIALCDIDKNVLEQKAAEVEKLRNKKPRLYGDYRKYWRKRD